MLLNFAVIKEVSNTDPSGDLILTYLHDGRRFSSLLRAHARRLGVSLQHLLNESEVSRKNFQAWQKGEYGVTVKSAKKIDSALKRLRNDK